MSIVGAWQTEEWHNKKHSSLWIGHSDGSRSESSMMIRGNYACIRLPPRSDVLSTLEVLTPGSAVEPIAMVNTMIGNTC